MRLAETEAELAKAKTRLRANESQNEQQRKSLQDAERYADQENHSQLIGRLSILGGELNEIRRLLRANSNSNGNQSNLAQSAAQRAST